MQCVKFKSKSIHSVWEEPCTQRFNQNSKPNKRHVFLKHYLCTLPTCLVWNSCFQKVLPIFLFDLEGKPWPRYLIPENVSFHEMHMHAFISSLFLHWFKSNIWPWRMILTLTCRPSICATSWEALATSMCLVRSICLRFCIMCTSKWNNKHRRKNIFDITLWK